MTCRCAGAGLVNCFVALLAVAVVAPACKKTQPQLVDDLVYFKEDITAVARFNFSSDLASFAWAEIVAGFSASPGGASALKTLLQGCRADLLSGATTMTIGTATLGVGIAKDFFWIMRGDLSQADIMDCLRRRGADAQTQPREFQAAGETLIQYREGLWATSPENGILISGNQGRVAEGLTLAALSRQGQREGEWTETEQPRTIDMTSSVRFPTGPCIRARQRSGMIFRDCRLCFHGNGTSTGWTRRRAHFRRRPAWDREHVSLVRHTWSTGRSD